MSIEAMKQMYEALFYLRSTARSKSSQLVEAICQADEAIEVGEKAIAEAEKQEPVAYVNDQYSRDGHNDEISALLPIGTPLYTHPQQTGDANSEAYDLAQKVIGCFHAAELEGLTEALAETADERLKDLVERRLMHVLHAAESYPQQEQEPAAKMTAHRAMYFMERFKREEKLLGPNEQAAVDFVISMLEAQLVQEPVAWPEPIEQPRLYADEDPEEQARAFRYIAGWNDCLEKCKAATHPQPKREPAIYDGTATEGGARYQADQHLRALLRYTENFYGAAIKHGMKAGDTANAIAHIEKSGKALHELVHAWAEVAEQREQPKREPVAIVHIKDDSLVGTHRAKTAGVIPDGQYGIWPIGNRARGQP